MKLASLVACIVAILPTAALAQAVAGAAIASDPSGSPWRQLTLADLTAAEKAIRDQDINAVYPAPAAFNALVDRAALIARRQASQVTSFAGYRATLKHFVNTLDDEHVGVIFPISQTRLLWPGFTMRWIGGHYAVVGSTVPEIADGAEITNCDGAPVDRLVEATALYEGGHPGLASTKASAALTTLIDQANPFVKRPETCVVGGRATHLAWTRLAYADYVRAIQPLSGQRDHQLSIADIGHGVAWVRIGTFDPQTPAEADAFRHVVAQMPALRNKAAIIFDVRQNGGGPYDWMVSLLNGLYGERYASFYARARLSIQPVYRLTPEIQKMFGQDDAKAVALNTPLDKATDRDEVADPESQAFRRGDKIFRLSVSDVAPRGPAPVSPVHAKVFVLTDYGCASVCIGFVDELKRIPGAEQIGTETFVDNRTGTPMVVPLPSGASFYVPVMTRDGRPRGDNIPQRPNRLFDGDITDTAAVRRWVLGQVTKEAGNGAVPG